MNRLFFAEFLLVGAGGFLGSGLRYAVVELMRRVFPYSDFPYGTVTVNIVGCFLIGYMATALELRELSEPAFKLLLLAGLLGGFTTFSAFSYENLWLVQNSRVGLAALNVAVQVGAGFLAAWAGFQLAKVF